MDIGNILNARGNVAAAAEARRQQQLAQVNTPISNLSDSDMEVSDHRPTSSDLQHLGRSVRYSDSFPSSISAGSTVPMNSSHFRPDTSPRDLYADKKDVRVSDRSSAKEGKPFACSDCGKGFARRSDLARHGRRSAFPCTLS